jgi:hypothetical protein
MGAMVLDEGLPGLGLSPLDPGENVVGEEGPSPVVAARIPFDVDPAVGTEVLADLLLEGEFFVDAHGEEGFILARNTAMEIPRPSRRRQQRHRVRGDIRVSSNSINAPRSLEGCRVAVGRRNRLER